MIRQAGINSLWNLHAPHYPVSLSTEVIGVRIVFFQNLLWERSKNVQANPCSPCKSRVSRFCSFCFVQVVSFGLSSLFAFYWNSRSWPLLWLWLKKSILPAFPLRLAPIIHSAMLTDISDLQDIILIGLWVIQREFIQVLALIIHTVNFFSQNWCPTNYAIKIIAYVFILLKSNSIIFHCLMLNDINVILNRSEQ